MGLLAAGQVVIVHFPFSDLSQSKLRPAVVLAEAGRSDWLLCQITSKSYGDPRAIQIVAADFVQGSLRATSYARPGKLFTAHASLVAGQIGELHAKSFSVIRDAVRAREIRRPRHERLARRGDGCGVKLVIAAYAQDALP